MVVVDEELVCEVTSELFFGILSDRVLFVRSIVQAVEWMLCCVLVGRCICECLLLGSIGR